MKVHAWGAIWLLPLLAAGCMHSHKNQQETSTATAPPIGNSAPPKPEPSPTVLPPSAATIPPQPTPTVNTTTEAPKPANPRTKRKKSSQTASAQASAQASSGGAAPAAPPVSAIGQLSSGEPADLRQQTQTLLIATERGLNGIGRRLNDQEQKTAAQIREFLKQAHTALNSGDLDGAHTLAAKAKVLLSELAE